MRLRTAALERDEGRRVCPVCGAVWVAGVDHRSNAVYCSPRCRRRAWAVNRIKKIKRQLYGRAGFELLRKMILLQ
ncbi:hypothetical protein AB0E04_47990 [Streptomyces sp. NPDC048251]|uniref:hypothetical protein n=1 Tax=Streptomyces sp. NPDC048251 TaxID=3154501 RepID=UPI003424A4DC